MEFFAIKIVNFIKEVSISGPKCSLLFHIALKEKIACCMFINGNIIYGTHFVLNC